MKKDLIQYIHAINFMLDKVNESQQYDKLILLCDILHGFNLDNDLFDFNLDKYTFTIKINDSTKLLELSDFVDVWGEGASCCNCVPVVLDEINISKIKDKRI